MTFKIKFGCHIDLLTLETMKLFASKRKNINKDRNVENLPHLKITEIILFHCFIVNIDYQKRFKST